MGGDSWRPPCRRVQSHRYQRPPGLDAAPGQELSMAVPVQPDMPATGPHNGNGAHLDGADRSIAHRAVIGAGDDRRHQISPVGRRAFPGAGLGSGARQAAVMFGDGHPLVVEGLPVVGVPFGLGVPLSGIVKNRCSRCSRCSKPAYRIVFIE